MANAESERLLNQIGILLGEEARHPLVSILLYARLDTNWLGSDIFIEYGDRIEYSSSGDSLMYPLLDLWHEEDPDKCWVEMEYVLSNGKFTVMFVYPGQFDSEEDFLERRQRVVARHFGNKPIVYPPLPDDDVQEFDL